MKFFTAFVAAALAFALPSLAQSTPLTTEVILTASSGNWTVPAGVTHIVLFGCGGGAGGGGVANVANATSGGGIPGDWHFGLYNVSAWTGGSIPYKTGAAGSGGSAGNNNGTNGGTSTFGPVTLLGGTGGFGSANGNTGIFSSAPASTEEEFTVALSGAQDNTTAFGIPGATGINAAGGNASGYCMGGGAADTHGAGAFAGGNGVQGVWVILY